MVIKFYFLSLDLPCYSIGIQNKIYVHKLLQCINNLMFYIVYVRVGVCTCMCHRTRDNQKIMCQESDLFFNAVRIRDTGEFITPAWNRLLSLYCILHIMWIHPLPNSFSYRFPILTSLTYLDKDKVSKLNIFEKTILLYSIL